jgi:hypothetical protein
MEDIFKASADYASRGWRVTPIHGLRDNDRCSCKNPDCGTPGKHPVVSGWQKSATTDEDTIAEWFDGTNYNVGVVLGEASGIVDIEWDDEGGKETAKRYGLTDIETPTYTSHRSEHRIFKFDGRLPAQAVIKVGGLEVRIGGGAKGAQSVFPPSLHASGVRYRWKYGFSPDEVDVAPIPDAFLQAIVNAGSGGELSVPKRPATEILHKGAGEGERHSEMCRYIARACIQMLDPHDPREQQDTLAMTRAINQTMCRPPLGDKELTSIWQGQLKWAIKVRAAGEGPAFLKEKLESHLSGEEEPAEESAVDTPFTLTGLEYRDGEWFPGRWRLRVIHNDPVIYVLALPIHTKGEDRVVDVTMDAETYRSAAKVAHAVLEATHTVILDEVPETWATIWCGKGARRGQPAIRGLKAKLMDSAAEEEPTVEGLRYARVAGWLLDVLSITPEPGAEETDDGVPDAGGRPSWVRASDGEWELWFSWGRAWEDVDRGRRKLLDGDQQMVKRLILAETGEVEFVVGRHRGDGGSSKRYIRFTAKHLRALERIATGEAAKSPSYIENFGT